MSRLLALDQATNCSGWAVFDGSQLTAYGTIECHYENLGARLHYIREEIKKLIRIYSINLIAFENIQVQTNVQTFKSLAELYGNIEELCWEQQIDYAVVGSSSWKSVLGVKGKARKEQKQNAQKWVLENYKLNVKQDTVDAICIGTYIILKPEAQKVNTKIKAEKFEQEYNEKGAF